MSEELKPCPFCNGAALNFHRRNTGATADWCGPVDHWVCCTGECGASTCMHGTKAEAIVAWNTRAPDLTERAAIVDWLRGIMALDPWWPNDLAEMIEAGEHHDRG